MGILEVYTDMLDQDVGMRLGSEVDFSLPLLNGVMSRVRIKKIRSKDGAFELIIAGKNNRHYTKNLYRGLHIIIG